MERTKRLKLKMIVSLFTCALSLFSLITLTLCWFAMNKNTDAGGMDVIVRNESIIAGCEYFVADSDLAASGYSFIAAGSEDKNKLGTYDVLNDKYQFLIKVKLVSAMSVNVTAETATDFFLGSASAKTDNHWLSADGTGNALSSVISFAVLSRADLETTGGGYKLAELPSDANTSCFFDRSAIETATAPEPSVNIKTDFAVDADDNGEVCFFVLLSYDPLLVSTVFSANIGNNVLEQDEDVAIPFMLDFSISVTSA